MRAGCKFEDISDALPLSEKSINIYMRFRFNEKKNFNSNFDTTYSNNSILIANSAEPPGIVIYCYGAPSDLQLFFVGHDNEVELSKHGKFGEVSFRLYLSEVPNDKIHDSLEFHVVSSKDDYYITVDKLTDSYNNLYRLNFKSRSLTQNKSVLRTIFFTGIRVSMTLLIEGSIFYIFGYRKKETWKAFLFINLITQGLLNLWFAIEPPYIGGLIFYLFIAEIVILITELLYLVKSVEEMDEQCMIFTVIVANAASFYLGMKIIPLLPI